MTIYEYPDYNDDEYPEHNIDGYVMFDDFKLAMDMADDSKSDTDSHIMTVTNDDDKDDEPDDMNDIDHIAIQPINDDDKDDEPVNMNDIDDIAIQPINKIDNLIIDSTSDTKSHTIHSMTHSNDKHESFHLIMFIYAEQYDTDSIQQDIRNGYGNLKTVVQDNNSFKRLKSFVYDSSIASFSTGKTFFYWSWYKNIDDEQYQMQINADQSNVNDLSGESIVDLYIDGYYESIQEEAVNFGLVSLQDFKELVVEKCRYYFNSDKCKEMKCIEKGDKLHYEIKENASVEADHLQALVLYTDFTALCTHFSSTFRGKNWSEPIKSIRKRHEKYYHIAKKLTELIQYYGNSGNGVWVKDNEYVNKESGPFYCGMSAVLNLSDFAIRLNGPTSTSTQLSIAIRFSGSSGCTLQLNNTTIFDGAHEVFCDASWISNYPEEDERIFSHGRWRLQIQSVRIYHRATDIWNNYHKFMRAFYLFDCMVSGHWPTGMRVTSQDVKLVELCIDHYSETKNNDLDPYINDTFFLFCQRKSQIILNIDSMDSEIKNKKFVALIMHNIKSRWKRGRKLSWAPDEEIYYDKTTKTMVKKDEAPENIFTAVLWGLFPMVKTIIITSSYNYPIKIVDFMKCMSGASSSIDKVIVKDPTCEWLSNAFSSSSLKNFESDHIQLKTGQGQRSWQNYDKGEDWLIFSVKTRSRDSRCSNI
eukprot:274558_1